MKQWNGLMRKEWSAMKVWFYGSIITQICGVLILSFASTFIMEEVRVIEILPIYSGIWGLLLSVILPTMVLLVSLNKEMHRPDVWLHSTAPTGKLFGVKALFASMIGFVNILFPLAIVLIESRLSGSTASFVAVFQFGTTIALMFFLLSLFIMCIGLFLGVLYQLLKPIVKRFSGPIVVVIFLFLSWLQARLAELTIYTKITRFGQLNQGVGFDLKQEKFLSAFADMKIYTGELLIDFALAFLFFMVAITLFEKKVRL